MFVPMLSSTDTPMASRKNTGSIHEVVDSTKISKMSGTRMANALATSPPAMALDSAVFTAWPVALPSSPTMS